jgi:hypothetical protein
MEAIVQLVITEMSSAAWYLLFIHRGRDDSGAVAAFRARAVLSKAERMGIATLGLAMWTLRD